MESRSPFVAFLLRQVGNVYMLTCLHHSKSGNGDKVSLYGFLMETSYKCFKVVSKIQKVAMETRSPFVAFFWRQVGNVSKITCLQNQKSGDGDKVSLCGFFYGDKLEIFLS